MKEPEGETEQHGNSKTDSMEAPADTPSGRGRRRSKEDASAEASSEAGARRSRRLSKGGVEGGPEDNGPPPPFKEPDSNTGSGGKRGNKRQAQTPESSGSKRGKRSKIQEDAQKPAPELENTGGKHAENPTEAESKEENERENEILQNPPESNEANEKKDETFHPKIIGDILADNEKTGDNGNDAGGSEPMNTDEPQNSADSAGADTEAAKKQADDAMDTSEGAGNAEDGKEAKKGEEEMIEDESADKKAEEDEREGEEKELKEEEKKNEEDGKDKAQENANKDGGEGGDGGGENGLNEMGAMGGNEQNEENEDISGDEEEERAEGDGEEENGAGEGQDGADNPFQALLSRFAGRYGRQAERINPQYEMILSALKNEDESLRITALNELHGLLLTGTEDSLPGFPMSATVQALGQCMLLEHNLDLTHLAVRCLDQLIEALPQATSVIVRQTSPSIIGTIAERLSNPMFIDIADACLSTLNKFPAEYGPALLRAGGLRACLAFWGFLATQERRLAINVISNMCRSVSSEHFSLVIKDVLNIIDLLQDPEPKIVDGACIALHRLVECLAREPSKVAQLADVPLDPSDEPRRTDTLIPYLINVLADSSAPLAAGTTAKVLHTLATICRVCPTLTVKLHSNNIYGCLYAKLGGDRPVPPRADQADRPETPSKAKRPQGDLLYELLSLAAELLPPPPSTGVFAAPAAAPVAHHPYHRPPPPPPPAGGHEELQQLLQDQPEVLVGYAKLLPLLLDVYGSTASPKDKLKCLAAIIRILYHSQPADLEELLRPLHVAGFAASLLASSNASYAVAGLQIADTLMKKLPAIYTTQLRREGVVFEAERITKAAPPVPEQADPQTPTKTAAQNTMAPPVAPTSPSSAPARAQGHDSSTTRRATRSMTSAQRASEPAKTNKKGRARVLKEEPPPTTAMLLRSRAPPAKDEAQSTANPRRGRPPKEKEQDTAQPPGPASPAPAPPPPMPPPPFAGLQGPVGRNAHMEYLMSMLNFPRPSSVPRPDDDTEVKKWLAGEAKRFLSNYFEQPSDGPTGANADQLSALVKQLQVETAPTAPVEQEAAARALATAMCAALTDPNTGFSGFEIVNSGLISALLHYLKHEDPAVAKIRRDCFADIFFSPRESAAMKLDKAEESVEESLPAAILIKKLHNVLNRMERLPVVVHEPPATTSSTFGNHLQEMTRHLMVRMQSNQNAKGKPVVWELRVDPLATIQTIEDHLISSGRVTTQPAPPPAPPAPNPPPVKQEAPENPSAASQRPTRGRKKQAEGAKAEKQPEPEPEPDSAQRKTRSSTRVAAKAQPKEDTKKGLAKGGRGRKRKAADESPDKEVAPKPKKQRKGPKAAQQEPVEPPPKTVEPPPQTEPKVEPGLPDRPLYDDNDSYSSEGDYDGDLVLGDETRDLLDDSDDGGDDVDGFNEMEMNSADEDAPPPADDAAQGGEGDPAPPPASGDAPAADQPPAGQDHAQADAPPAPPAPAQQQNNNGDNAPGGNAQRLRSVYSKEAVLRFTINGHVLPRDMTIFAALAKYGHTDRPAQMFEVRQTGAMQGVKCPLVFEHAQNPTKGKGKDAKEPTHDRITCIPPNDPVRDTLDLMALIFSINVETARKGRGMPVADLTNNKIEAKLTRQLEDPLAVASLGLPDWCSELTTEYPFLFRFETRQQFLQLTSFGLSRALGLLQKRLHTEGAPSQEANDPRLARLTRYKVVIERSDIFRSCRQYMKTYAHVRGILEMSFKDEAGIGLGPTLEFYHLASKEFTRKDLGMWRIPTGDAGTGKDEPYIQSLSGLYPAPLPGDDAQKVDQILGYFTTLGRFMARALLDSRLIDLPLSPAFYAWLNGTNGDLSIASIQDIDPTLAKSLESLERMATQALAIQNDRSLNAAEQEAAIGNLRLDGVLVDDLCLDFTLPGYPHIELKEGGRGISVTNSNVAEYVRLVVEQTLCTSVERQMQAYLDGVATVIPLRSLVGFTALELDMLFCGAAETWDPQVLSATTKPDHGYNATSQPVLWLYDILSTYDPHKQRQFLQFITGAPRLPVGGLRALSPPLTVVRRDCRGQLPDEFLPSVMTCQTYLKLPEYSSKAIMAQRLDMAMNEGAYAFDLS